MSDQEQLTEGTPVFADVPPPPNAIPLTQEPETRTTDRPPNAIPITDLITEEQDREVMAEVYQRIMAADDPRSEEAMYLTSMYLERMYGIDSQLTLNNFDQVTRDVFGKDMGPQSAWEAIRNEWELGWANLELGLLYWEVLTGSADAGTWQEIESLQQSMPAPDEQKRSLPVAALKAAANMLPVMIDGLREGAIAGVAGAGFGGLVGGLTTGGAGVAPGMYWGFRAGAVLGSGVEIFKVEAGGMLSEFMNNPDFDGMDPDLLRAASFGAGAVIAAIEQLQILEIPGMDTVVNRAMRETMQRVFQSRALNNLVLRTALNVGANLGPEVLQEAAQESTNIFTGELLKAIDAGMTGTPRETDWLQIRRRLSDTIIQSALAFSVIGAPGNVRQTIETARELHSFRQEAPQSPAVENTDATTDQQQAEEADPKVVMNELTTRQTELQTRQEELGKLTPEQRTPETIKESLQVAEELDALETEIQARTNAESTVNPVASVTRAEWLAGNDTGIDIPSPRSEAIREQIRAAAPQFDDDQVDGAALILDMRADALGVSTEEYVADTFQPGMIAQVGAIPEGAQQQDFKAAVQFAEDGKALIYLTENSDFSSWVHETGHIFQRQLDPTQASVAETFYGVENSAWTVEQQERFATDFENYIQEGIAPTPELGNVFQRFAQWLTRVYNQLRGQVSPEIRSVFDSLLTKPESPLQNQPQSERSVGDSIMMQPVQREAIQFTEELDIASAIVEEHREMFDTPVKEIAAQIDAGEMAMAYDLPELLDAPELFDKYPRMRNVRVVFNQGTTSHFSRDSFAPDGRITVNLYGDRTLRTHFYHELQHAVQFAKLGDQMFDDYSIAEGEYKNQAIEAQANETAATGRLLFQPTPPTDSQAFRDWFGDSKVVDENGQPLVVYHGTQADFTEFGPADQRPFAIEGTYFTANPGLASMYAEQGQNANVMPVYLAIQNPVAASAMRAWASENNATPAETTAHFKGMGYDGAVDREAYWRGGRDDAYVAFDPTQIKSAIANQGTYDPANPNILYQPGLEDAHERAVREAVEAGQFVDDRVLADYADRPWVIEERAARERYQAEAFEHVEEMGDVPDDEDGQETEAQLARAEAEWIEFQQGTDPETRGVAYYKAMWARAKNPRNPEEIAIDWAGELTKERVQAYLDHALITNNLDKLPHQLAITAAKKGSMSDAHFAKLMQQINYDKVTWYNVLADVAADDDALRLMDRAMRQNPEASELQKRKEQITAYRREIPELKNNISELTNQLKLYDKVIGDYEKKVAELSTEATETEQAQAEALKSARQESKKQAAAVRAEERKKASEKLAEYKRKQKAAREARDYYARLVKRIMRKPEGTVAWSYAEEIRNIQATLDTRSFRRGNAGKVRQMLEESFPDLTDPELQEILEEELGKRSLRDMSQEELESIDEAIAHLRKQGKDEYITRVTQYEAMVKEYLGNLVGEIGGSPFWNFKGTKKWNEETKSSFLDRAYFNIFNMERIADRLGKTWKEVFVEKVNTLENQKIRLKDERMQRYAEIKERTGLTERDLVAPVNDEMTLQEAMGIWILSKNDDGRSAVESGNAGRTPFGMEQIGFARRLVETTDKYREFAQGLMDMFDDESFARLQEAVIDNTNQAMNRVSFYFPLFRQDVSTGKFENEITADLANRSGMVRSYVWSKFKEARTHARSVNQPHVRIDAVAVALEAIEKQEHYANHAAHVKLMNKLLGNASVKDAFVAQFGRQAYQTMMSYVEGIADPAVYRAMSEGDRFFNTLRNNYTKAVLAYNIMSGLKQIVGPLLYLPNKDMTAAEMLGNVPRLAVNMLRSIFNYKQMQEFVDDIDPQARRRTIDPALEAMETLREKKLKDRLTERGLKFLQWMDKWTVTVGAFTTYQTMKPRLGHQGAIEAAQEATRRTQPVGGIKDRPAIYNSPAKIMLMFTTPLSQMLGMVKDVGQARSKVMYTMMMMSTFGLTGLLMWMFDNKEPPEDERELALALTGQWLQILPFIGPDFYSQIESKVRGEHNPFVGRGFAPLTSAIPAITNAATKIGSDDATAQEQMDAVVRAITQGMNTAGVPGVVTGRMWNLLTKGEPPPAVEFFIGEEE